ncbi:hypothetical protein [Cupriavidus basilensis]|uniref:hypothetical protein n=1 Tax=Cupriavidus basilensis TaxID=68895 RepID=UPI0039F72A42
MTTIAWDGTTLAADRCSWSGGVRRRVRKIYRVRAPGGRVFLVAFCGNGDFAMAILAWMRGGDRPDPAHFDVDKTSTCAVVIDERGGVWQLSGALSYGCRMRERVFAQGAGHEFAWGALEAGATARRAVLIAAKRSDYAALGVDCVRF